MRQFKTILLILTSVLTIFSSCDSEKSVKAEDDMPTREDSLCMGILDIPMRKITVGSKEYNVANINDSMQIYCDNVDKDSCFFVISKREYRLYVYHCTGGDTLLAAHFPICYAVYPEAKQASGDMRTPECSLDSPFVITEIVNASNWHHDFGDGRGSIPSYGPWFMRLKTGFQGIGIHGSTNNDASVPGRDSEGCIRLRDEDIVYLYDLYSQEGTPVIIKNISDTKWNFEIRAQKTLSEKYRAPKEGNPLCSDSLTNIVALPERAE